MWDVDIILRLYPDFDMSNGMDEEAILPGGKN